MYHDVFFKQNSMCKVTITSNFFVNVISVKIYFDVHTKKVSCSICLCLKFVIPRIKSDILYPYCIVIGFIIHAQKTKYRQVNTFLVTEYDLYRA